MSAIVLALLFVMFHEFLQPKTSHLQLCTLYKSWRLDPVRIHCGSIHLIPQQNCVWLLGNTSYYHSHPRIYKSIGQRNVGKQSWNYGTKFLRIKKKTKLWFWSSVSAEMEIMTIVYSLPRSSYALHRERWPQHALLQLIFVFHHHQNSCTIWPNASFLHDFVSKWIESEKHVWNLNCLLFNRFTSQK